MINQNKQEAGGAFSADTGLTARVSAVHRDRFQIIRDGREEYARLKPAAFFTAAASQDYPTVGDNVTILPNPMGDALIVGVLPRKSFFSRRSANDGKSGQAIAANFDYVFLLASLNQDLNLNRLERYLTLAWQSGGTPVILLTKADLRSNPEAAVAAVSGIAPGVEVHALSAHTGQGMEALEAYLKPGALIVLLGSSGVGKSSLVNRLAGEDLMEVREIREDDARGRHTTTHRQMIPLPGDVMIIDTPGMRELGMWGLSTEENGLGEAYHDVEALMKQCRFHDCGHVTEPGCAVRAALESGELARERWSRYQKLLREARHGEKKARLMEHRAVKTREQEALRRKKSKAQKNSL